MRESKLRDAMCLASIIICVLILFLDSLATLVTGEYNGIISLVPIFEFFAASATIAMLTIYAAPYIFEEW